VLSSDSIRLNMQRPVRVLLVDDQHLVRKGLAMILSPTDGFEIVGEVDDGAAALEAATRLKPDVVLMDIRMKGMDGIEATRRLRARDDGPPVLVLTTFDDDEVLSSALRAGAAGFILKDAPSADIIRSTRAVADGGAWLDPTVTGRVLAAYRSTALPASLPETRRRLAGLTVRELDVLRLLGRGLSNEEIARSLTIGEATVKTHVGHILDKLALRDRSAAIVFAFDHQLVERI
jgi:DNA-binding NarL/FixJ family response regulator